MEISFDSLLDDNDHLGIHTCNLNSISVSQREDGATIQKIQGIGIPEQVSDEGAISKSVHPIALVPVVDTNKDKGLFERLSNFIQGILGMAQPLESNELLKNAISEWLEALEPEEFDTLEEVFVENPEPQGNYVIRLQNLVAAILAQLQQISDKDKEKINQLEKEYKLSTLSAANLQRELGWSGLKFAAICFGASFLQFLSPHQSDRDIAMLFADKVCPKFGEMWNADLNAKFTSANNSCTLKMNKYNLLANAEQSKANDKQQVSGIFDKALRNLESATRFGG